MFLGTTNLTT